MTFDVRAVIVCMYCVTVSVMLSLTVVPPVKSILFSLLTSAALHLILEKFSSEISPEGEE